MWKYIESLLKKAPVTERQRTGLWGEAKAEQHLKAKGYRIISRRFRIGRRDEIDLIARKGETLVFIEVKTRSGESFGRPLVAVDRAKRFRMARAAVRYLKRLEIQPANFRFDVVEIIGGRDDPEPVIRHVENAFPLPNCFHVL